MKLVKIVSNTIIIAALVTSTALVSGCGGVGETELEQLQELRDSVNSLESEANALKEERSRLERDIAEKNAKLQQCAKDKEQTRANLEKLPK